MLLRRHIPFAVAGVTGVLMLAGLIFNLTPITNLLLNWASFLAAAALLIGVLNLLTVHARRVYKNQNLYSAILVISMLAVFGLAITDSQAVGLTDGAVMSVFEMVQAPMEAALASLVAFFLLFAGIRLLRRRRSVWSFLFLLTAVVLLISQALMLSGLVPVEIRQVLEQVKATIDEIFVIAGVRGLLIGVAIGTATLGIRVLLGQERPYMQ